MWDSTLQKMGSNSKRFMLVRLYNFVPRDVKTIKSFLALSNYCAGFIASFAYDVFDVEIGAVLLRKQHSSPERKCLAIIHSVDFCKALLTLKTSFVWTVTTVCIALLTLKENAHLKSRLMQKMGLHCSSVI
jgi:hypothetical protein